MNDYNINNSESASKTELEREKLFKSLTNSENSPLIFPNPEKAGQGLLGYTEEISTELLYSAYLQGIFPWFNEAENEPVLWWSPDPRFVLLPEELHIPKSLTKFLKHTPFTYTINTAFEQVINNCAKVKRKDQKGTWIGSKIIDSYCQLAEQGNAHSIEVWHDNKLAGGFYGVLIGQIFFGESMFSLESNSAKSALIHFVNAFKLAGGKLIDSQVYTDNIARFGGKNISRTAFLRYEKDFLYGKLNKSLADAFYEISQKQ